MTVQALNEAKTIAEDIFYDYLVQIYVVSIAEGLGSMYPGNLGSQKQNMSHLNDEVYSVPSIYSRDRKNPQIR